MIEPGGVSIYTAALYDYLSRTVLIVIRVSESGIR